ncbi:type IV pilus modification PilV family protein [Cupriavidus basilensis]|uniref:type IV pilus modification PilV family protein n=1 Tax=Cupriavidus basilensis TaxID=68895 RepID=UPI0039F6B58A
MTPRASRHGKCAARSSQCGATLIEVLISVVILLVALLGTAGLIARSSQSEMESYQRVQALTLLQDMAARLNGNRQAAPCYASGTIITTAGSASVAPPACAIGTAAQVAIANADLAAWGTELLGSAEISGGKAVGAMIGALGCIEAIDAANQIYRITVAWQGLAKTAAPALPCGSGQFGDDANRRAVSIQVRIGVLS